MDQSLAVLGILVAITLGSMSPGPSFVVIARVSLAQSRAEGIAAAAGLGVASMIFTCLALGGLHVVLEQVGWLYLVVKLVGGAYLVYLAYRIFTGAKEPLSMDMPVRDKKQSRGLAKAFLLGFGTQLSNPKTAIVFASVFATFLTARPEPWLYLALVPAIFMVEATWYSIVATALSSERPRRAYGRAKGWIDRIASTVLGVMGASLIGEAVAATD
ncbi:LysE family translocator [Aestuariispira ectoiniformans]|uniref:LysE family translocator n=1 Tax=Aestuariispira ectoiniformans TaxID=2775080 RepID=UPI00223AED14|nr:LysE family transporter [Aestuariispira ectoiniformans]